MSSQITVFTDGASRGNPGPGGWGALVISQSEPDTQGKVFELGGREEHTTNNRMEMTAALMALLVIKDRGLSGSIEMHTDSAYLLNGITMWVYGWEKNNWLTKEGEPVQNQDLWEPLVQVVRILKLRNDIAWKKVAGHSGLIGNERVDAIATHYADRETILLFTGAFDAYQAMLGGDVLAKQSSSVKTKKKTSSSAKAYSYVSCVDGIVAVDTTWAACEKRVKGKKGAKYKKALSAQEEAELIEQFKQ